MDFLYLWIDILKHRNTECRRLAGTCLGLSDEVAAVLKQMRYGYILDFSRSDDVVFLQSLNQPSGNSEFFKIFQSEGICAQSQSTGKDVVSLPQICGPKLRMVGLLVPSNRIRSIAIEWFV